MSIAAGKPAVGIFGADSEVAASLDQWLRAAGFSPHRGLDLPLAAVLLSWPSTEDLHRCSAPIILLAARNVVPPPEVVAKVVEVVTLPDPNDVKSILSWSSLLLGVLRQVTAPKVDACRLPVGPPLGGDSHRPAPALIAIGVSTGGPVALPEVLGALRGNALPPVVIVQHIPTSFLGALVERLGRTTGCQCTIAREGESLQVGTVYFAPGEQHLRVVGGGDGLWARLDDSPPRRGHRPAAEVLFESCAELPVRGIGVIMTGMGQDGAQGLLRLRQLGWTTIGQSEATCAIYGMPGAAKRMGAVGQEAALADIGPWLVRLCQVSSVVRWK